MMYWGTGMGGWGMLLMTVSSLLFWALVVGGLVALVRYTRRDIPTGATETPAGPRPTPQQLLAERFARGEIDEDEYHRCLQVLTGTASAR